jgi:hypothetical protein
MLLLHKSCAFWKRIGLRNSSCNYANSPRSQGIRLNSRSRKKETAFHKKSIRTPRPKRVVLRLDRPISAKRRLNKKGFPEGKESAGLFPGFQIRGGTGICLPRHPFLGVESRKSRRWLLLRGRAPGDDPVSRAFDVKESTHVQNHSSAVG